MSSFQVCCSQKNLVKFSYTHSPKPITFTFDMQEVIKILLWYVPNIESLQSEENPVIKSKVYSECCFNYLIKKMGLNIQKDVCWLDSIDDTIWRSFDKECCISCSKIIVVSDDRYSKTENLLRHIRNSIAHARFTIVNNNLFIGYDINKSKVKKAIIKVNPKQLLNALYDVTSGTLEFKYKLYENIFIVFGYITTRINKKSIHYNTIDLIVEKHHLKYLVEIKKRNKEKVINFKKTRKGMFIHTNDFFSLIKDYDEIIKKDYTLVLVMDDKKITNEIKPLLNEYKVLIIDKTIINITNFEKDPILYARQIQWNKNS